MIDGLTSVDSLLISRERTEKLELLLHLIANSSEPVVLCGPDGIGKTTLINAFKKHKNNAWRCCSFSADIVIDFDTVLEQLASVTGADKKTPLQHIGFSGPQTEQLILIIDDAGKLAPGMLTHIIGFALGHPVLRVVFALTPDEIFIKTRTDQLIDDCYFIEIPPLSEKQCGDFLHYLAIKSPAKILKAAITDQIVETIYRNTQGIPALILLQLPNLPMAKDRDYSLWLLIAAVVVLVVIALSVQWLSNSGHFQ